MWRCTRAKRYYFDAGSKSLLILNCNNAFASGDISNTCGLLDLIEHAFAESVDRWIYEQFRDVPPNQSSTSSSALHSLRLHSPNGDKLEAQMAWLEIPAFSLRSGDGMPVTLRLLGVTRQLEGRTHNLEVSTSRNIRPRRTSGLDSLSEEISSDESIEDAATKTISPDDSISAVGVRRRPMLLA
jgi:hypothetical protein